MLTVILTGGGSRRMGTDKANLPIEGATMLSLLVGRYCAHFGRAAVSVDVAGRFAHEASLELVDSFPGKGPLNGLYSVFTQTKEETVFLTATDLPFGEPLLAECLLDRIGGKDACVIRREGNRIEPLFGIYRRESLNAVKHCLEAGRLSFPELFERLDVRFVPESELGSWDLKNVLMNVNTPEDYSRLLKKFERNKGK